MTQAFNLSQLANKVNSSGELDLATGVTGTLPVNEGGTGQTTYTNGQVLIGNSTGNTLTKSTLTAGSGVTITNGAGSITIGAASGQLKTELFSGPGTWTKPATVTEVRVTVVGGGGGSGTVPTSGGSGGTSSFGSAISCTGGGGGFNTVVGTPGTGTVSVGTALRTTHAGVQANGILNGLTAPGNPNAGQAFSTTTNFGAGRGGARQYNDTQAPGSPVSAGGNGGVAIAIVPVSAPVSITIGSGGNCSGTSPTAQGAGVGGAILVEYVG